MPRPRLTLALFVLASFSFEFQSAEAAGESWRYYRPGNTGIQGDYNKAVRVAPDGDPYIGGDDPGFEVSGFAKFIQSENRWVNYSIVESPVIGHPGLTGILQTESSWAGTTAEDDPLSLAQNYNLLERSQS